MKVLCPPEGKRYTAEECAELVKQGIYPLDNGGICHPQLGADHHDMTQIWYKSKPTFYRRLSASQLLLLPEFREGILRRHRENPVTTLAIHGPVDSDCAIAQFVFKKIISGQIPGEDRMVHPIYHRLAHYANCYDRFVLPYLPEPEFSLKGMIEGLSAVCKDDPDSLAKDLDALLETFVWHNIDPNNAYALDFAKQIFTAETTDYTFDFWAFSRGITGKRLLRENLLKSDGWKNRLEKVINLETRNGLKSFTFVSISSADRINVYDKVYGENLEPSVVLIWNSEKLSATVSVRPDAVAQGVSLFSLITKIEELEEKIARDRGLDKHTRWFDGVIYDGTVTFPMGQTLLDKAQIQELIFRWSEEQERKEKKSVLETLKTSPAIVHRKKILALVGLPAGGKSFVVDLVEEALRFVGKTCAVIASDQVRKEHEENPAGDRHKGIGYGHGIYTEEQDGKNYEEVFARTQKALEIYDLVIIDATFRKRKFRQKLLEVCGNEETELTIVEISAPKEVMLGRSASRWFKPSLSDATPDILEKQFREYEPLSREELADERISFAASFVNCDQADRMVANTCNLVMTLVSTWYPDTPLLVNELERKLTDIIKGRIARLESKKVIPHDELLLEEDLSKCCLKVQAGGRNIVAALQDFSDSWLSFLHGRTKHIAPHQYEGEAVKEARLITQVAHSLIKVVFDMTTRLYRADKADYLLLGLEVKTLFSNLDLAVIPLNTTKREEAQYLSGETRRILTELGWPVNNESHLLNLIDGKTLNELQYIAEKDSAYIHFRRNFERAQALLLVSKVLWAPPDMEKRFRNKVIMPLFSNKFLLEGITRVEAPKLKRWAAMTTDPETPSAVPDIKDTMTRGLYGLVELMRLKCKELTIEVEQALQNPLMAEKKDTIVILSALDFCLRFRMVLQQRVRREESLILSDKEQLTSLAQGMEFADTTGLLETCSSYGQKVFEIARRMFPEYYN